MLLPRLIRYHQLLMNLYLQSRGVAVKGEVDGTRERSNVVYSSLVSSSKGDREYIGSCSTSFKAWFNNRVSDSNLIHRWENTMLADHKWYLKERNIAFTQTWKLKTFSRSYTSEAPWHLNIWIWI